MKRHQNSDTKQTGNRELQQNNRLGGSVTGGLKLVLRTQPRSQFLK